MAILISYTLIFAAILLLVALGGCFSEHSGVINIGLEGIMVIGALGGALIMQVLSPELPAIFMILIVMVISMLSGMIYSLLLAVAAINLLATAGATVIVRAINSAADASNVSSALRYGKQKDAFGFDIAGFSFNWFVVITVIILIAANIVLYKTKFGLRLRACGEHPQAADSVGINVYLMRYAGVLISGALGGLGGIVYITTGVSEWKFEYGVAGFGFLVFGIFAKYYSSWLNNS